MLPSYNKFYCFFFFLLAIDANIATITSGGGGSGSTNGLTLNGITVNNITAPTSDPPSVDDQTLITKSYKRGLPIELLDDIVNYQSKLIKPGTSVNLETDFSVTFPSWAKLIRICILNSGGYKDYITMDISNDDKYTSVTGPGSVDTFKYTASTKNLQYFSGGGNIYLFAIRAEGNTII